MNPAAEQQTIPQQPIQPKQSYVKRLFSGRLNRKNYTIGTLLLFAAPIICYLIFLITFFSSPATQQILLNNPYDVKQLQNVQESAAQDAINNALEGPVTIALLAFMAIYTLLVLPFAFSLQIRRLHDLNKSGWWLLIGFIPIISYFFPIYVALAAGTDGENKYGPKPLPGMRVKEDILVIV